MKPGANATRRQRAPQEEQATGSLQCASSRRSGRQQQNILPGKVKANNKIRIGIYRRRNSSDEAPFTERRKGACWGIPLSRKPPFTDEVPRQDNHRDPHHAAEDAVEEERAPAHPAYARYQRSEHARHREEPGDKDCPT